MRILHIVDSLEFGGLERLVTDLATAQQARGHEVAVFSLLATDGHRQELQRGGVEVVVGDKRGSLDLAAIGRLRATCRRRGVQVAHAHSFVPNYYAATSFLGLPLAPALVGTCHDMGLRLAQRKLRWMYRTSLLRTARVAMVGRQVHDRLVGSGIVPAAKAATVLNGIPVERFRASETRRSAARLALELPDDALVIGAVGRLVELKNHALLIDTVSRMAASWPDLRLVIVGGGPLEAALRARAAASPMAGRIHITGHRSGVADLIPAFDIFAMPSRTEGVSIALLEACASSLAVVATRVGGNPEIVVDGQTGLLVPPDDGPALGAALQGLLADPARREAMGQAACTWVRTHASIDVVCDAYERLYREALGER